MLPNIFCETNLIAVLNLHKLTLAQLVICIYLELIYLRKVCNPIITNLISNPVSEKRIAMKKETSLCDTICLIVKLLRHHLIEILELLLFKYLCVKLCNTVDREACCDCKMCHLNLSIIYDCHFAYLLLIARIHCLNLLYKTSVDFFNNLIYSRKKS